jgi:Uma2 family endonuclease
MNATIAKTNTKNLAMTFPKNKVKKQIFYPSETKKIMGETALHFKLIRLFTFLLESFFSNKSDITVGGDLMIYIDEDTPKKWLAPDVFVCFGVENKMRRSFKTWEEGVFPQIVFEVASESTFENDLGGKRLEYARLGVEEYYLLDPEREYLPSPLMAFKRENGRLIAVNVENNRILSPLLNIEIVDTGKFFRLFNPKTQEFLQAILTGEE